MRRVRQVQVIALLALGRSVQFLFGGRNERPSRQLLSERLPGDQQDFHATAKASAGSVYCSGCGDLLRLEPVCRKLRHRQRQDPAPRDCLVCAGQRYFDFIAKRRRGIAPAKCHSRAWLGFFRDRNYGQGQPVRISRIERNGRPPFLLEADGTAPIPRAEFYCGVFGRNGQTADSAGFYLNNLPPGKYAAVIFDAPTSKGAYTVSLILQQIGPPTGSWEAFTSKPRRSAATTVTGSSPVPANSKPRDRPTMRGSITWKRAR